MSTHTFKHTAFFLLLCCFLIPQFVEGQSLNLKFTHLTSQDGLPQNTIHGINKDKYGFMWFGTWSGLARYDGYKFKTYLYDPRNPNSIPNNRIHNIHRDENGDLWILTFDAEYLAKYNYETDDFERVSIENVSDSLRSRITRRNHIQKASYTFQDYHWHLDRFSNTIVQTHIPTGTEDTYHLNPANMWAINDTYISDFYLDDQQILWLGTYSSGINKAFLNASPFEYYYYDPLKSNSIAENVVRSITEDKNGSLWVGTRSKGISVIDKNGRYRHLRYNNSDINSIQSDFIKKVFCDSENFIWIGTQKGLDRYNPHTKQIERIIYPELDNRTVFDITEDAAGNIWIASWNGLYTYNKAKNKLIHFDSDDLLPSRRVWCIFLDREGKIWAGTEGAGIAVIVEKNDKLVLQKHLYHDIDDVNTISDNRIYNIYEDRESQIWISTGNGLDRYDPTTGIITHLSQPHGSLAQGVVGGVIEDSKGYLWASHKKGISRIDKQDLQARTFSQQHGLQSNEFSQGAVYKSPSSGKLYFGASNGINYFSPNSIKTDRSTAPVVLTQLHVLNKPVQVNDTINGRILLHRPLHLTSQIDLRHEDKSIAFEFALLHYTNPNANQYAYMLEGFDQEWIHTDATQRVATYSNLAPGRYIFKVKAANSDGIWNPTVTSLKIKVAPAWWASTWAYVFYTLLCLIVLVASYYYIVRYTRLKSKLRYEALLHEKERELHESKLQFFTNISHEIKTPLTLILSPIQQLTQLVRDSSTIRQLLETMQKNGDRLMNIVNQLLDIRRLESGFERLQLSRGDMVRFIHEQVDRFADAASAKNIQLAVSSDSTSVVMSFDKDKIEKVLNNLLSNALKFTSDGGQIKVYLATSEANVSISVIDNGIGIPEQDLNEIFIPFIQSKHNNPTGSGLGLTYAKSLVELHGGTLLANSRQTPSGNRTEFVLTLPSSMSITAEDHVSVNEDLFVDQEQNLLDQEEMSEWQLPSLPEKPTLLLIEDNPEMRAYLGAYFQNNYHVLEAEDGEEGLDLVKKHMPDLVISDVMMPKMDGISFTARVKSDLLTAHIPVILLTARSLPEYEMEGLKIGADDYIVKPFNIDLLSLKVKNQLLNRIRLQEKFRLKIAVQPTEVDVTSPDEKLLQKVLLYVEDNIADTELNIDSICKNVGLSRAQIYRKMKALTGYSMADMIREIRLKRAQQLLREKKFNISEIAYMVGFSDVDYFRKSFKVKFDQSPTEYARQYRDTP